jgi:DNA polymerase III alpha subunit
MKQNTNGEMIFDEQDLCNLIMQGRDPTAMKMIVDRSVDIESAIQILEDPSSLITWTFPDHSDISVPDWDNLQQQNWHMPQQYKDIDIAEHVLNLCRSDAELQRVGHELLMYQERNLFDLLRYLHYLVDTMKQNRVIWGVGRGSSVASYVLYLLGVHRIDSMFYDLDPSEFLR